MSGELYVLILADAPGEIELMKLQFNQQEHRVKFKVVSSEQDFVKALQEDKCIDFVLFHDQLKAYDGFSALRKLKSMGLSIPLIFITDRMDLKVAKKALNAGAADFIVKANMDYLPVVIYRVLHENEKNHTPLHTRQVKKGVGVRTKALIEGCDEEVQDELLLTMLKLLAEPSGFEAQLRVMLRLLRSFGKVEIAEIWLGNFDGSQVSLKGQVMNPEFSDLADPAGFSIGALGKGLPGVVMEKGEIVLWKDLGEQKNFYRKQQASLLGIEAALGAPIVVGDRVVGVFVFMYRKQDRVMDSFIKALKIIGPSVGPLLQLRQSEEELRRIFTLSPDVLCVIGMDGYVKKASSALSQLSGYSHEDLLRLEFLELIHLNDRKAALDEIATNSMSKSTYSFECRCLTKEKDCRWFVWTGLPLPGEGLIIAVGKDIHERKLTENRLKDQNRKLKEIAWTQSHKVRAPLSRILSLIDWLKRGESDEGILDLIEASAEELDIIVRSVVDKSQTVN